MDNPKLWMIGVISFCLLLGSFAFSYHAHVTELENELKKVEADQGNKAFLDGHRIKKWGKRERVIERRKLIVDRHPIIRFLIGTGDFFGSIVGWMQIPNLVCFYGGVGLPVFVIFLCFIYLIGKWLQ